jgi:hypothetical protein
MTRSLGSVNLLVDAAGAVVSGTVAAKVWDTITPR